MTAVDRWDYALADLLAEDAKLGHPSWCDRGACYVKYDCDGGLTGSHLSAQLAAAKTDDETGCNPADYYFRLEQWCTASAPVVRLDVMADYGDLTVSLHPDQLGPLVDAITTAAKAVSR